MKKILALIIALLTVLCLAGCADYSAPTKTGTGSTGIKNEPDTPPDEESDDYFSVTLVCADSFIIDESENIEALWSDGMSVHSAPFDANGVAKVYGLDGDYTVTLSKLPTGYTYNSNLYTATNYNRDIEIELYKLQDQVSSPDSNYGQVYKISSVGVYRATLSSPSDVVYFEFNPTVTGLYTVTSIMDVTANVINPILDIFTANAGGYRLQLGTVDDGGIANTYTKNFRWEMNLQYVGNLFFFGVRTESLRSDAFPINIDIIVARDGDYNNVDGELVFYYPQEDFSQKPADPTGSFMWFGTYCGGGLLDGSRVKLNPEDGYYHIYENGVYGALIYVAIDTSELEFGGFLNPYLTLKSRGSDTNGVYKNGGRDDPDAPQITYAYDYKIFISTYMENSYEVGNAHYYPVNAEWRLFLQRFAVGAGYFLDGNGQAEGTYAAAEGYQWLFNCGLFV